MQIQHWLRGLGIVGLVIGAVLCMLFLIVAGAWVVGAYLAEDADAQRLAFLQAEYDTLIGAAFGAAGIAAYGLFWALGRVIAGFRDD